MRILKMMSCFLFYILFNAGCPALPEVPEPVLLFCARTSDCKKGFTCLYHICQHGAAVESDFEPIVDSEGDNEILSEPDTISEKKPDEILPEENPDSSELSPDLENVPEPQDEVLHEADGGAEESPDLGSEILPEPQPEPIPEPTPEPDMAPDLPPHPKLLKRCFSDNHCMASGFPSLTCNSQGYCGAEVACITANDCVGFQNGIECVTGKCTFFTRKTYSFCGSSSHCATGVNCDAISCMCGMNIQCSMNSQCSPRGATCNTSRQICSLCPTP